VVVTPEEEERIQSPPTNSITAYDYYLRGKEYYKNSLEESNFRYAVQQYEKAVEIDPEFILAWVGLAGASRYFYWFFGDRSEEQLLRTRQYLEKAIALDPELKEVQLEEARYYYHCRLDFQKALRILTRLNTEYPNDDEIYAWIGYIYRRIGDFRKSLEYNIQAIELNPAVWNYWLEAGNTLRVLGNYREVETYYKKAFDLNPSITGPCLLLLENYILAGKIDKASDFLTIIPQFRNNPDIKLQEIDIEVIKGDYEQAVRIAESMPEYGFSPFPGQVSYFTKHFLLGMIYHIISDKEMSNKHFEIEKDFILEKMNYMKNDYRLYCTLGVAYAGLGNKKLAKESGKKALDILSLSKDSYAGFITEISMAKILLMIGEYDEALTKLEYILNRNRHVSVELIKNHPFWDPLRTLDRYEEIILNPKYQINFSDKN
ncbi:MAG: hypothetical protein KFF73_12515, partial [Cyclobacteriaceae bacterium]|nr:hypothetical protein [Cyclobacteriaceae bacterium]